MEHVGWHFPSPSKLGGGSTSEQRDNCGPETRLKAKLRVGYGDS